MKLSEPKLRLYLDTTIPSYMFALDTPERMLITREFMRTGQLEYEMLISDVVMNEIIEAPEPKRQWLLEIVEGIPRLQSTTESNNLAQAYIDAQALPRSSFDDAHHVALATLNRVDALISWNFGHLVNIRRTRAIGKVNEEKGLPHIQILTPEEVLPL